MENTLADLSALVVHNDAIGVQSLLKDIQGQGQSAAVLVSSAEFGSRGSKPALHKAATLGRAEILEHLLATNANPNARDDAMNTPLLFAADLGHARAVHVLLRFGADAMSANAFGSTPQHKAEVQSWDLPGAIDGKPFIQRMLAGESIAYDCLPAEPRKASAVRLPGTAQRPALAEVLVVSDVPLLDLVGRNDASAVEARLAKLMKEGGRPAVRQAVMSTEDALSPSRRRRTVQSALHVAALKGHAKILEMLLATNADPNTVNDQGNTPLHLAKEMGQHEAIHVLLTAGANSEARNNCGRRPDELMSLEVDVVTAAL